MIDRNITVCSIADQVRWRRRLVVVMVHQPVERAVKNLRQERGQKKVHSSFIHSYHYAYIQAHLILVCTLRLICCCTSHSVSISLSLSLSLSHAHGHVLTRSDISLNVIKLRRRPFIVRCRRWTRNRARPWRRRTRWRWRFNLRLPVHALHGDRVD